MSKDIDIHVLELLSSKICHDLISPIGAIYNGVEFLEDMGPDAGDEVTGLIAHSAKQASAKLQAYRMIYGVGGADSSIKYEDVAKIFNGLVELEGKIKLNFDPHAPLGPAEPATGLCKMLMATLFLALECLPKGGEISVEDGGNGDKILIHAHGDNANFAAEAQIALELAISAQHVEPKYVHPYIAGLLGAHHGFTIECTGEAESRISFTLASKD